MVLTQLDALVWVDIALQLPDPSRFAATCKLASNAINTTEFRFKWFDAHHRAFAPNTPWQYAAVTWQQMRGASAQQLAEFIINYTDYNYKQQKGQHHQKQQQQQLAGAHSGAVAAGQAAGAAEDAAAQVLAQAPEAAADAGDAEPQPLGLLAKPDPYEGRCSAFPECTLLPSLVRRAKQLLRAGAPLDALLQLCPSSRLLLQLYAGVQWPLHVLMRCKLSLPTVLNGEASAGTLLLNMQ